MAEAGVTTLARSRAELGPALVELLDGERGRRQRDAALALFGSDPAVVIAGVATAEQVSSASTATTSRR
jgi:hypothetical protein